VNLERTVELPTQQDNGIMLDRDLDLKCQQRNRKGFLGDDSEDIMDVEVEETSEGESQNSYRLRLEDGVSMQRMKNLPIEQISKRQGSSDMLSSGPDGIEDNLGGDSPPGLFSFESVWRRSMERTAILHRAAGS